MGGAGGAGGNVGGGAAGTGGAGGAGGAGGNAGAGGAGGAGGNTGAGGAGGAGGGLSGTVLLLAGGGADILAGALPAGGAWITSSLADKTGYAPAIVMTSATSGVGVIRSDSNAGELRFTTWISGSWAPFSAVAPGVTTRAAPSAAFFGGAAHAVFHGDNYKHYHGAFQASWNPTAEPVGGAAAQSFGPNPAAAAALTNELLVAFAGSNGDLFAQSRAADWTPAVPFNLGDVVSITPAAVALDAGADAMITFVRKTDAKILWTKRIGAAWSAPVEVPQALTADPPALAPVAGGGAVLAFRGTNMKIYTTIYSPGSPGVWSVPAALGAFTTPGAPALARGVSPADAELAFIDSVSGGAIHARLMGGVWSVPEIVGGAGKTSVALATTP